MPTPETRNACTECEERIMAAAQLEALTFLVESLAYVIENHKHCADRLPRLRMLKAEMEWRCLGGCASCVAVGALN